MYDDVTLDLVEDNADTDDAVEQPRTSGRRILQSMAAAEQNERRILAAAARLHKYVDHRHWRKTGELQLKAEPTKEWSSRKKANAVKLLQRAEELKVTREIRANRKKLAKTA
jgi:hypothetical protein